MTSINKPEYIILHHSAVSRKKNNAQYDAINNYHKGKGWGKIGYHYLIEPDGTLMAGRNHNEVGAHCKEEGMNYKSFGVCLTGDLDEEKATDEQLKTLRILIKDLRNKYNIPRKNVKFHRDYATYKTCPGNNFTKELLNKTMALQELKRDTNGGFWFIKKGDNGKQQIDASAKGTAALLTVISREFGVDTVNQEYLDKLEDKKYF